jgi:hypothetical protein
MPAGTYGYDPDMLARIISATVTAIDKMRNLNGRVIGLAGELPSVNNSASGVKLAGLLNDWTREYGQIVNNLDVLNDKVNGLLQTSRSVSDEASSASV